MSMHNSGKVLVLDGQKNRCKKYIKSKDSKVYHYSNSIDALAGLIRCKYCNTAVAHVSNKRIGYYGCCNAKRKGCDNKSLISAKQLEAIILIDLMEKFLMPEDPKYSYKGVEKATVMGSKENKQNCLYYVSHTSIQALPLREFCNGRLE